jgi:hypothetical protein
MITNTAAIIRTPIWSELIEKKDGCRMFKRVKIPQKTTLLPELIELLGKTGSIKIIGTLGEDGAPHLSANDTLTSLNGITLVIGEERERSQNNKNLVRGIWYDKPVAIFAANTESAFEIRAKVYRCLAVGGIFDAMLARAREKHGPEADIAVAWEFVPETCRDVSQSAILAEHNRLPYYDGHLDRADIKCKTV